MCVTARLANEFPGKGEGVRKTQRTREGRVGRPFSECSRQSSIYEKWQDMGFCDWIHISPQEVWGLIIHA